MSIFLLWFSIFSFTVFSLSILTAVLRRRQRGRRRSDSLYLTSMTSIAVWLILFSFLYFSDAFVRSLSPEFRTAFGLLRAVVTLVFLISYSFFIRELFDKFFPGRLFYLLFLVPLSYIVMLIPVFLWKSTLFAMLITTIYNIYVSALTVTALLMIRKKTGADHTYIHFLRLMFVYHAVSLLLAVLPMYNVLFDWRMFLGVMPRALFCLVWGLIELILFISREYQKERQGAFAVSTVFTKDYGITPREREIILHISDGCSNRETAGKLFISEKTVETHVYSIYRKCGVKNKVGLLNLISKYD